MARTDSGPPMSLRVRRLVFSVHARDRMQEREVDEQDVRATLRTPDTTWPSGTRTGGVEVRHRFSDGRTLHVSLQPEADGERHRVVTVFWVEGTTM